MRAAICAKAIAVLASFAGIARADMPSLKWQLGANTRLEGEILVADVAPNSPDVPGQNCAIARLDTAALAGRTFRIDVRVRGEEIAGPGRFKVMPVWRAEETGVRYYPEPWFPGDTRPRGTFGWTNLTCYVTWRGTTVTDASLFLGLEGASGRAFFDLSSLKVAVCEDVFPWVNEDLKCRYDARVADLPPLRGAMSAAPLKVCEDDVRTLASWGGRLLRYQMHASLREQKRRGVALTPPARDAPREAWQAFDRVWLDAAIGHLATNVLPWVRKCGLKVVIDLHQSPGGVFKAFGAQSVFSRPEFAEDYFAAWRRIATALKGNEDVIYGYDLMNEPSQKPLPLKWNYWTIQERAAREIRRIDPVTPIVFAANEASEPDAFRYLSPIDLDNVIYQVHFYRDNTYTHGRWTTPERARVYPDAARGFDKDYLRRLMFYVRRFQQKHGARILCGEFSACGWAPGADRWIADVIDLLEENGWDWTFHAFREADMWSVERVYDGNFKGAKPRPSDDNPRMRALKAGLQRGVKR